MTTRSLWTRLGLLLTIPALLLLGACDTFTGSDDDHDDDDEHEGLARVEIEARDGSGETLAVWTDDDGWEDEALPSLEEDGERAVWTVRMFAEDGDEFPLEEGGEYEARYAVDDDAPGEVIYFDEDGEVEIDGEETELFHGDHIYVYPQNAGTTRLRFILWHDDHAEDSTVDFIDLTVEAADNGNGS